MYKWTSLFAQTGLCAQPADTRISDVTFIKGNHTTVWSTIRHRKARLLFCNYAKLCTLAESRGSVQGCAALCMSAWILPPGDGWNVTLVSGGESYRMSCTHCCTQSDNLFSPIMNMDIFQISHKWVGFVSCPHPQADLAMTCRCAGHFQFFMRLPLPLPHFLLPPTSCFVPYALTNHRAKSSLWKLFPSPFLFFPL